MKITDLMEFDATVPPGQLPTQQQINDPKVQTQMLAAQQKQKMDTRKQIQDQIQALTKQIADLRRQLAQVQ